MGNNRYRNLDSSYYIRRKPNKKKKIKGMVILGVCAALVLITVISVIFLILRKSDTSNDAADLSTISEAIPEEEIQEEPQAWHG